MKSPPPLFDHVVEKGNLLSAFRRVQESDGGAGVDGVTITHFERNLHLADLHEELVTEQYEPLPLLRILVEKKNGEPRPISIPAVRDRVAQAAVLNVIGPIFEAEMEDCSFAYRKGRSVKQAVAKVCGFYEEGFRWVVDADIDAFFDNVDHELLLKKVRKLIKDNRVLKLIQLWIESEIWDGTRVYKLERGIPQGSVVSPVLANLFLDEMDEAVQAKGYKIVRFADDFLILCKTPDAASKALELTQEVLKKMSLVLDEADVVDFDHGFSFLGVTFIRSLTLVPFNRMPKKRKILFFPPPLDVAIYRLKRTKGW